MQTKFLNKPAVEIPGSRTVVQKSSSRHCIIKGKWVSFQLSCIQEYTITIFFLFLLV